MSRSPASNVQSITIAEPVPPVGPPVFTPFFLDGLGGSFGTGITTIEFPDLIGSPTLAEVGGTLFSGNLFGYDDFGIATAFTSGYQIGIGIRVPNSEVPEEPQTHYFTTLSIEGIISALNSSEATFVEIDDYEEGYTYYVWRGSASTSLHVEGIYEVQYT